MPMPMMLTAASRLDGSLRSRIPRARRYSVADSSVAPCRNLNVARLFNETAKSVVSGACEPRMSTASRSNGSAVFKSNLARVTLPSAVRLFARATLPGARARWIATASRSNGSAPVKSSASIRDDACANNALARARPAASLSCGASMTALSAASTCGRIRGASSTLTQTKRKGSIRPRTTRGRLRRVKVNTRGEDRRAIGRGQYLLQSSRRSRTE